MNFGVTIGFGRLFLEGANGEGGESGASSFADYSLGAGAILVTPLEVLVVYIT